MAFKVLSDDELEKEEKWEDAVAWVIAAIDNGFLDKNIKNIARACYDRKQVVDNGGTPNPARWTEFPAYVHIADAAAAYRQAETTPDPKPADAKPKRRLRGRNLKDNKVDKATTAPTRSRRTYSRGEQTFRYTDGKLYNKSDVRGKLVDYRDNGKLYTLKITGVSTRAKVMFVGVNGIEEKDPERVPVRYTDEMDDGAGVTIIKNPIFMPLDIVQPIINQIKPIEEK